MIRIIQNDVRPRAQDLIGRIVMRDAGFLWRAVADAMRVESVQGTKLAGTSVHLYYEGTAHGGAGGYVYDQANSERRQEPRTMPLRSVIAVCDTPDEVAALRNYGLTVEQAFRNLKLDAAAGLAAMNGMVVEPDDVPGQSSSGP